MHAPRINSLPAPGRGFVAGHLNAVGHRLLPLCKLNLSWTCSTSIKTPIGLACCSNSAEVPNPSSTPPAQPILSTSDAADTVSDSGSTSPVISSRMPPLSAQAPAQPRPAKVGHGDHDWGAVGEDDWTAALPPHPASAMPQGLLALSIIIIALTVGLWRVLFAGGAEKRVIQRRISTPSTAPTATTLTRSQSSPPLLRSSSMKPQQLPPATNSATAGAAAGTAARAAVSTGGVPQRTGSSLSSPSRQSQQQASGKELAYETQAAQQRSTHDRVGASSSDSFQRRAVHTSGSGSEVTDMSLGSEDPDTEPRTAQSSNVIAETGTFRAATGQAPSAMPLASVNKQSSPWTNHSGIPLSTEAPAVILADAGKNTMAGFDATTATGQQRSAVAPAPSSPAASTAPVATAIASAPPTSPTAPSPPPSPSNPTSSSRSPSAHKGPAQTSQYPPSTSQPSSPAADDGTLTRPRIPTPPLPRMQTEPLRRSVDVDMLAHLPAAHDRSMAARRERAQVALQASAAASEASQRAAAYSAAATSAASKAADAAERAAAAATAAQLAVEGAADSAMAAAEVKMQRAAEMVKEAETRAAHAAAMATAYQDVSQTQSSAAVHASGSAEMEAAQGPLSRLVRTIRKGDTSAFSNSLKSFFSSFNRHE